jgi:hypothetical protein
MSSNSEIIARNMAALKNMQEAAAAREETKKLAREEAKKAWQLSELARIERGPTSDKERMRDGCEEYLSGYGGYLDGYRGQRS